MVEFALVLPILLALVTAIAELGLTFSHYLTLQDAVRSGARVAAVSGPGATATVQAAVTNAGRDIGLTPADVTVTYPAGTTDVVVSAGTNYSIGFFGLPVKTGRLISSTTERVEQ